MAKHVLLLVLISPCWLLIAGCSSFRQDPNVAVVRDALKSEQYVTDLAREPEYAMLSLYAGLSASIYVDNPVREVGSIRVFSGRTKASFHPSGWTRHTGIPNLPMTPKGNLKLNGLGYEVWVNNELMDPRAIIVFRGTDCFQLGDWLSNFRWVVRFIPGIWDQYDQTRCLIPDLVEFIQGECGPNVRIAATGHSLGGGLAQQAAYASPCIKKVYAFDPSSVTGFYSVDKTEREENRKCIDVYRIYQRDEVLSYLRFFMKWIHPVDKKDPRIVEIRYNRLTGNSITKHGIKAFARELDKIEQESQLNVLNDKQICPPRPSRN